MVGRFQVFLGSPVMPLGEGIKNVEAAVGPTPAALIHQLAADHGNAQRTGTHTYARLRMNKVRTFTRLSSCAHISMGACVQRYLRACRTTYASAHMLVRSCFLT